MICFNCKSEVSRVKIYFTDDGKIENCSECPEKYIPKQAQGLFITSAESNRGMTVAHYNDISRRRLGEDGRTVIRDYGKIQYKVL